MWEARFSQGESQQRSTHTRTHVHVRRGRITPIYLARQQPASVCTALTPAQPNLLLEFLITRSVLFVCVGAQPGALILCVLARISICICFSRAQVLAAPRCVCVRACARARWQSGSVHIGPHWNIVIATVGSSFVHMVVWSYFI